MSELQPAREFLKGSKDDFGFWFNDQVVLMVREGTYFGAARPGHTLSQEIYPCFDVDEALKRAGVAPDELGEGY